MSSSNPDSPSLYSDPISGVKVIYAPQRARRANAFAATLDYPATDEPCPFCPGHEADTPPETYAWPPPPAAWQIRIVPNRFPALSPLSPGGRGAGDEGVLLPTGHHEVLIESPNHDDSWTTMPAEQLAEVFQAIRARITAWSSDPSIQSVQIFKNVGSRAGASLPHPHLQLMGMNFTPKAMIMELERSKEYWERTGVDYWQSLCSQSPLSPQGRGAGGEGNLTDSSICNDGTFLSFCPPVSRVPYEIWLTPTQPWVHFHHAADQAFLLLAKHLQRVLKKVETTLGPVAHNILWHLPPLQHQPIPYYRWRIEILPRLVTFAGFELSAGIYVNPIRPEAAASLLRTAGSF